MYGVSMRSNLAEVFRFHSECDDDTVKAERLQKLETPTEKQRADEVTKEFPGEIESFCNLVCDTVSWHMKRDVTTTRC